MDMRIDAQYLKKLREEKSWSQEHLAEAAGLSLRTVQRAEADGNASPETKMALAATLGVDAAQLTAAEDPGRADRVQRGFLTHLFAYALVKAGLVLMDLHQSGSVSWSRWPMMGWGLGLLCHWLNARRARSTPE